MNENKMQEEKKQELLLAMADLISAMVEAIKSATETSPFGGLPSGELFAMVCGTMSIDEYTAIIDKLVAFNLIRRTDSHLLVFIKKQDLTKN